MRRTAILLATCLLAMPAAARDSLGVYERWGAFRDPDTPRCYAIARPERAGRGEWQPFASIGSWPRRGVFNQVHIRLRRPMRDGEGATLIVGDREFELVGRGPDAWARDRTEDAAIVAAIRAGQAMRVQALTSAGRLTDRYDLNGAASAIDAAALGCAR